MPIRDRQYGPVILSVILLLAFGMTLFLVLTKAMPTENQRPGDILLGALAAMSAQACNFWFSGSARKDAQLAAAQDSLASSVPASALQTGALTPPAAPAAGSPA